MKPMEIILIDSSSEDNTAGVAEKFGAKVMKVRRRDFNHGKTRNVAAAEARGDILVFMTQDAFPCDDALLRNLTAPLRDGSIAASYGRQRPSPQASPLEVFAREFNYPGTPCVKGIEDAPKYGIKTFFFSNACSAINKERFGEAGMFPEGVRANEDMIIAARLLVLGYKVAYVPEASVIHSHNLSLLDQFRRYYNIGSSLRKNIWVLRHARSEGEGIKFLQEQARFILKQRRFLWIPYMILESAVKYAGYRIGLLA